MIIRPADLDSPDVIAMLEFHHSNMQEMSPPGTAYAFEVERMRAADIQVYGVWMDNVLVAVGAMRSHDEYAELKSMRTLPEYGGQGIGKALLTHLLNAAREAGFDTVRLETGKSAPFTPANRLYLAFCFTEIGPFAGYEDHGDNRFYELSL